ncbi:hypothetical protein LINPERHAP1_LOCUS22943, partial [Linum perenne]
FSCTCQLLAVSPLFKCSSESKPGPYVNSQVKLKLFNSIMSRANDDISQSVNQNEENDVDARPTVSSGGGVS